MSDSLLFVHSPLVGPSSMQRLADSAAGDGYVVSLPDLTAAAEAETPLWRAFVERAVNGAARLSSDVVVIGHSGAGSFLPQIGEALGERLAGLVFVDAVVPPELGFHTTPGDMIDTLAVEDPEGLLLPWLEWWPDEDVADLLPDANDRRLLAVDMPRVPRVPRAGMTPESARAILEATSADAVATGGYVLSEPESAVVTLVGTGSEVSVCIDAAAILAADGVPARVVSLPCWTLFEAREKVDRDGVLRPDIPSLGVEAGVSMGWHRWVDDVVTIDRFGASAPGGTVMRELGISPENVAERARAMLEERR